MPVADNKVVADNLRRLDLLIKEDQFDSEDFGIACKKAWDHMAGNAKDVLVQCLWAQKPVWVGDLVSKVGRDTLMQWGLLVHICYGGQAGFYATTERAKTIFDRSGAKRPVRA